MKRLIYLLIIGFAVWYAYDYVSKHSELGPALFNPATLIKSALPAKDSQGRPLVDCPRCHATGTVKCTAPKCKEGKVDCPGPCLKLSVGRWEKLKIAGHDPDELWQTFKVKGGTQSWSQAHIGEVVDLKDGRASIIGKCQVCGGTAKVDCKVCAGTAQVPCPVCKGQKQVPDTTKPAPKPSATSISPSLPSAPTPPPAQAETIRLKDGRTILGVITIRDETTTWIRTVDGKKVQMPSSEVISP